MTLTQRCGAWLITLLVLTGSASIRAKTPDDQLIVGMNMNNLLTWIRPL